MLIDPVLGRLALPPSLTVDGQPVAMADPVVSFHYGAAADIGGGGVRAGGHLRATTWARRSRGGGAPASEARSRHWPAWAVPASSRSPATAASRRRWRQRRGAGERIELRAADGSRPTVELGGELVIDLDEGAEVTLNGLVLAGAGVRVPAAAKGGRLRLVHCTLVPGISLLPDGARPAARQRPAS